MAVWRIRIESVDSNSKVGAGLPFFKYTLAGDLIYGGLLFGIYALAAQASWLPGIDAAESNAQFGGSR